MTILKKHQALCPEVIKMRNLTANNNPACRRDRYKPYESDSTHNLIFNGFDNIATFIRTLGIKFNHKYSNKIPRLLFDKIKPSCSSIYLFKA